MLSDAAHPLAPETGIFSPKEKTSTGGSRGEATLTSVGFGFVHALI